MMLKFELPFVFIQLLAGLSSHLPATAEVVYYVLPSYVCFHNNGCPSGETCYTMDYYASKSSYFFSPDYVNVTLYFICGIHNCTNHIDIHDLQTFAMIGTAGRKDVTINMPIPTEVSPNLQDKGNFTYTFTNVSNVTIENVTINYISVSFEGKKCTSMVRNVDFHGYVDFMSSLVSVINITSSQALLDNCTFQQNCFIRLQSSAVLTINDCKFHSYHHRLYSAIAGNNSTIILSGTVYFVNNTVGNDHYISSYGAAISFNSGYSVSADVPHSVLNFTCRACVYFNDNTASGSGGALYLKSTTMDVGFKTNITFIDNRATDTFSSFGGAILLSYSHINIGINATLQFTSNSGTVGGAVEMRYNSLITLDTNAAVYFINNTAKTVGGAIHMIYSKLYVSQAAIYFVNNTAHYQGGAMYIFGESYCYVYHSILHFVNNFALGGPGGAIFLSGSDAYISGDTNASFINNTATQGGAVYQSSEGDISIAGTSRLMFYNNVAGQGGALYLFSSASVLAVRNTSLVQFINNSASGNGGAVYVHLQFDLPCFLVLHNYSSSLQFVGNSAQTRVGMHLYGASIRSIKCTSIRDTLPYCGKDVNISISFAPNLLSPVASDPKRVCLCDLHGHPQCANLKGIFVNWFKVYAGEPFKISVVVVGYDFGVTTGTIHADFMTSKRRTTPLLHPSQYHQLIRNSNQCSNLNYTVYSTERYEILHLQTTTEAVNVYGNESGINTSILKYNYDQHTCLDENLLTTPVFINITLVPGCPPGFTFANDEQLHGCNCYPVLNDSHFSCFLINNTGYLKWNSTMWVGAIFNKNKNNINESSGIMYTQHCPLDYCISGDKTVDLGTDPDAQCAFNHAGILCGGCKENYSLAIGSSRCIRCSKDSYLALVIFFAAAGFLLVIFILALNLTVTQGLINGLIFYANVVWAYKGILLPSNQESILLYFQIFIAWLNLDFGIESCFVVDLNAFWKTWLQFLFPLYIWFIAGMIIIACRYSTSLTNLIGDRAVPLLATLFLLSYMKLLHTVVTVLEYAELTRYPDGSKLVVWYLDGNLPYCQHSHVFLFIASLATLLFLCIPFTIFLFLIQCWRRISHLRPLRWINKFTPVYDAYLAPLKHKHHYWFGTLLLVRGALLVTFTLTSATSPTINLLVLQISMVVLLVYVSFRPLYKHKIVRILESASVFNLIVLTCTILYAPRKKTIILELSLGFAFVQFCIIVLVSLIKLCYNTWCKCTQRNGYKMIDEGLEELFHEE